ncbi:23S rRNA (guanosine(2251)-2'-O)-methyltransferase RlmB [Mycoplasma sp. (ex Biomphalaria glabrata)]|uniref:23S rRNA (guanosine(2251)-2'-O)-methyltransferase RlmB n=1 Tax=Mycoplasma sp. (ex Biomphalaria glabrata) TaxID=1749074 RepID=UPI00214EB854|nr:23S rRNA (guanosine(2251)-2'-O)-methyltransferase RlmB [Mycoplasma sp. (ex Biomphalaria glabrata)]
MYGKQQVLSAIKSGKKIDKVYCTPKSFDMIDIFNQNKIIYKLRPSDEITKIAGNNNHQNVVALVYMEEPLTLEQFLLKSSSKEKQLIVILDKIQDPHNFGSILRSCEIYKTDAVIFGTHEQAPITPVVTKTSAGALNYLDVVQVGNISQAIEKLKQAGFWIYATGFSERAVPLSAIDLSDKMALVLGNEGDGVSKNIFKNSDFQVKIEMLGNTESLNVSVSCGVCLYFIRYLQKFHY